MRTEGIRSRGHARHHQKSLQQALQPQAIVDQTHQPALSKKRSNIANLKARRQALLRFQLATNIPQMGDIQHLLFTLPSPSNERHAKLWPGDRKKQGEEMIECTHRESEVLILLGHGLSNKTIAARLTISPYTVRDHISSLLQRHGLCNRVELAIRASETPWQVGLDAPQCQPTKQAPSPIPQSTSGAGSGFT